MGHVQGLESFVTNVGMSNKMVVNIEGKKDSNIVIPDNLRQNLRSELAALLDLKTNDPELPFSNPWAIQLPTRYATNY